MKIELRFHTVYSLKDKRSIVNSVKQKIFSRFKTSISEIEDQDLYNSSVLGLTFVSNKKNHAVTKGQNIVSYLENHQSDIFYDYNLLIEEY